MMNWLRQILGIPEQKKSAVLARERLMVIVAHERGEHEGQPDFLPLLQKELTEVIAKYVKIDQDQVQVDFEQKGGRSVLELNITLPEHELKPNIQPEVMKASPAVVAKPKPNTKPKTAESKGVNKPSAKKAVKKPIKKTSSSSMASKKPQSVEKAKKGS